MMFTAKDFREMSNTEILNVVEVALRVLEERRLDKLSKRTLLHLIKYGVEILEEKDSA